MRASPPICAVVSLHLVPADSAQIQSFWLSRESPIPSNAKALHGVSVQYLSPALAAMVNLTSSVLSDRAEWLSAS